MKGAETSIWRFSGTSQNITVGAASAQATNAFAAATKVIRISSTTACWVNIGVNPTAAAADNNYYVPANIEVYLQVTGGQKIAAIQAAAGGTCNVAEMTH